MILTRFAPSPTGFLHLGHAYSALFAAQQAQDTQGRFLLRIEDIDSGRCRPAFTQAIFQDLEWLGLVWEQPVRLQSEHMDDYQVALEKLDKKGVLYPCFCTRKQIQQEIAAAGYAPHEIPNGPDGAIYPGTCKSLTTAERADKLANTDSHALRMDMGRAIAQAGEMTWRDHAKGLITARPEIFGDVILARKDTPTSYHLSVTVDDHRQGITLVTRGQDLFEASHIHRLLQSLLDLNVPEYHHHPLLNDETGRRLAKRDKARTLQQLREDGMTPDDVKSMILQFVETK